MISVTNLKMEFGTRPLFEGVSFVVNKRDRIALVGKNGAGKSTLLKILSLQQRPTQGEVALEADCTVGYLPQVMKLADTTTVVEETAKAFSHIDRLREKVERLEEELSRRTDYESDSYMQLLERFTEESERFQLFGGDACRAEMERTLTGLGFERQDFDRPTAEFSGGWRMRIELAKILLMQPDVLLLDEPTNHLDIESIRWLEQLLARSPQAVVLVSHDRAFINNVTNRTLEISCHRITDYRVSYDQYVTLRAERRESQLRAWQNQQKEIADLRDFIERFRYKPTKANQVQSRIKQLEKIVPIEVDEVDNASLHLKFPPCQRSGDFPVACDEVGKTYGEHNIFSGVNLHIRRGEKVAFVGKNGEGKSTLVKCIMGEIPHDGTLKIGAGVQIGYYAQNQAQMLDDELTVFDTIDRVAVGDIRLKIRDILGAFMFGGEASEKKVKVLSGGERSRLAMISLLLQPVNFLILDEPTNHLDMRTKDVLKEALLSFDGTVILVSHDREFLDGLATRVYEFAHGHVREHLGGIYDYLREHEAEQARLAAPSAPPAQRRSPAAPTPRVSGENKGGARPAGSIGRRAPEVAERGREGKNHQSATASAPKGGEETYQRRKERGREQRRLEKELQQAEQRVEDLEREIARLEDLMATPAGAADTSLFQQYGQKKTALLSAEEAWEKAAEALESASV